jgi:hypothetical protein
MLPFYKMILSDETEGMDFIALVNSPAHRKSFEYFNSKEQIKYHFNEEQRIVTGVAIAVDLPIYRNDSEIGEHYVVFGKKETLQIAQKMFKNNYLHNVNEMHDSNKQVKDIYLFESYFLDSSKGKNAPDSFKNQNLKDGSWIVSYRVDNDQVWSDIKSGKHIGFSIEGWFNKENIKLKQTKMSDTKKGKFWKALFGAKEEFTESVTVDGTTVIWDGDLRDGIELRVRTEEGEMLAPEGVHSIENEETGEITVITVDGNGMIVSVETGEVEQEQEEEMSETQKALIEIKRIMDEGFSNVNKKVKELEEAKNKYQTQLENLAKELDKNEKNKFNNKPVQNWAKLG